MASAKEYYAKYEDRLAAHYDEEGKLVMDNPEEANTAVQELLMEFVQETKQRIKDKNLQNDRSVMALVNVMNNKWNTVCASFNPPVLRKNIYRNIVSPSEHRKIVPETREIRGNKPMDLRLKRESVGREFVSL